MMKKVGIMPTQKNEQSQYFLYMGDVVTSNKSYQGKEKYFNYCACLSGTTSIRIRDLYHQYCTYPHQGLVSPVLHLFSSGTCLSGTTPVLIRDFSLRYYTCSHQGLVSPVLHLFSSGTCLCAPHWLSSVLIADTFHQLSFAIIWP